MTDPYASWSGEGYAADGSARVQAGDGATLSLSLGRRAPGNIWRAQDLGGRSFFQTIADMNGNALVSVVGAVSFRPKPVVQFVLTAAETSDLLPAGRSSVRLQHQVGEIFSDGRSVFFTRPFIVLGGGS